MRRTSRTEWLQWLGDRGSRRHNTVQKSSSDAWRTRAACFGAKKSHRTDRSVHSVGLRHTQHGGVRLGLVLWTSQSTFGQWPHGLSSGRRQAEGRSPSDHGSTMIRKCVSRTMRSTTLLMRVASWATRTTLGNTCRRFDGLDYYAQKFMMHHRLAKRRRSIWADFIDGADMQVLSRVKPKCMCVPARRSASAP